MSEMMKKIMIAALIVIMAMFSVAIYIGQAPWEPYWLCGPGYLFEGRMSIVVDTIFWGILLSWYYILALTTKSIANNSKS